MVTRPDQGLALPWAYSGKPVLRAFFSRGWESQKREREKNPGVCTFQSLNLVSHFPPSFSPLLTGKQLRIMEKCVLGWKMQQIKYDSIEKMNNQTHKPFHSLKWKSSCTESVCMYFQVSLSDTHSTAESFLPRMCAYHAHAIARHIQLVVTARTTLSQSCRSVVMATQLYTSSHSWMQLTHSS